MAIQLSMSAASSAQDPGDEGAWEVVPEPDGEPAAGKCVLLFGKTGSGKSSLGNLLLNWPFFDTGDSLSSITNDVSVKRGAAVDGSLVVLDTPGFCDTSLTQDEVVKSIRDIAVEAQSGPNGGIDLLFFIMKKERFTAQEHEVFLFIINYLFGPECIDNLYVVVSHAQKLAVDEARAERWLQDQVEGSAKFADVYDAVGRNPRKFLFVENPDVCNADDSDEERNFSNKQQRAREKLLSLVQSFRLPPYRHDLIKLAQEAYNRHLAAQKEQEYEHMQELMRQAAAASTEELHQEYERKLQEAKAEIERQAKEQSRREINDAIRQMRRKMNCPVL